MLPKVSAEVMPPFNQAANGQMHTRCSDIARKKKLKTSKLKPVENSWEICCCVVLVEVTCDRDLKIVGSQFWHAVARVVAICVVTNMDAKTMRGMIKKGLPSHVARRCCYLHVWECYKQRVLCMAVPAASTNLVEISKQECPV